MQHQFHPRPSPWPILGLCAVLLFFTHADRTLAGPMCEGDVNGDGGVDLFDLVIVGRNYGLQPPDDPRSDLNGDGATNLFDLVLVASHYNERCPTPEASEVPGGSATPTSRPTPSPTRSVSSPPAPTATVPVDPTPVVGGRITLQRHPVIQLRAGGVDQPVVFVAPGAVVTWWNRDTARHELVGDANGPAFGLAPEATNSWLAPAMGIFVYQSRTNPRLDGAVVVTDAATAAGSLGGQTVADYYRVSCSGCHGLDRQGAMGGPALPPGMFSGASASHVAIILDGRPGTAMGSWRRAGMTDAEAWALMGYLRTAP